MRKMTMTATTTTMHFQESKKNRIYVPGIYRESRNICFMSALNIVQYARESEEKKTQQQQQRRTSQHDEMKSNAMRCKREKKTEKN